MMRGLNVDHDGWRFATFLDEDGHPPCDPPGACSVCVLFDTRRHGETRAAWIRRIWRHQPVSLEEAS